MAHDVEYVQNYIRQTFVNKMKWINIKLAIQCTFLKFIVNRIRSVGAWNTQDKSQLLSKWAKIKYNTYLQIMAKLTELTLGLNLSKFLGSVMFGLIFMNAPYYEGCSESPSINVIKRIHGEIIYSIVKLRSLNYNDCNNTPKTQYKT